MSGVIAAVGIGSALVGAYTASEQRRAAQSAQDQANQQNLRISKAQAMYSPWTGIKPQNTSIQPLPPGQSDVGGAIQGGLAGVMFGQQMANQNAAAKAAAGKEVENEFNAMPGQETGSYDTGIPMGLQARPLRRWGPRSNWMGGQLPADNQDYGPGGYNSST